MKRSIEKLSHFVCDVCNSWFSVASAPEDKHQWSCPWCGTSSVVEECQAFNGEEMKKALDDLAKNLAKAVAPLENLFKK